MAPQKPFPSRVAAYAHLKRQGCYKADARHRAGLRKLPAARPRRGGSVGRSAGQRNGLPAARPRRGGNVGRSAGRHNGLPAARPRRGGNVGRSTRPSKVLPTARPRWGGKPGLQRFRAAMHSSQPPRRLKSAVANAEHAFARLFSALAAPAEQQAQGRRRLNPAARRQCWRSPAAPSSPGSRGRPTG